MKRLCRLWGFVMQVMGDGDYARYRAHLAARHPGQLPLRPDEYYLLRLEEKYTRPTRCC